MSSLDEGVVCFLVWLRVFPLAAALAWFSMEWVPTAVALSGSMAIAVALVPFAGVVAHRSASALFLSGLRELCLGGVFAITVTLALSTVGWAARWSVGVTPRYTQDSVARAYTLCALFLVTLLGGHRVIIVALGESFRDAPLSSAPIAASTFAFGIVQLVADAFAAALGFALPLMVAVYALDAAVTLATRVLVPALSNDASVVRSMTSFSAAALLLVPTASHAPTAVRAAIASARALTQALAK